MSKLKKLVRETFRNSVFKRDQYKCKLCNQPAVDAHHITDRHDMPAGGYVKENGISLCSTCHILAEEKVYQPSQLYKLIGSSYEKAVKASHTLL